ncbi:caspase family protein [Flexithrix dorotheae]|uniref:caspase family protein n=1 Tax=Flexithrix dorotheae TaxID=70993 RepID=UPI00039E5F5C|nr:caspase family protein [Flexithrix dorotheae]
MTFSLGKTETRSITFILFLLLLSGYPELSHAQDNFEDYATIYIYKPKSAITGVMRHTVNINGKELCWLRNGARMKYKIYTEGPVPIQLKNYMFLFGSPQREASMDVETLIHVKSGESYYMRVLMNIDGSGEGFTFVDESIGEMEYYNQSMYKKNNPEIILEEDLEAFYAKQANRSIQQSNQVFTQPKPNSNTQLVKNYVEEKMEEWRTRGRYEKSEDYNSRVTKSNQEQKIKEFTDEGIQKVGLQKFNHENVTSEYDPDNETFRLKFHDFEPIYLNVPIAEARDFDNNFRGMVYQSPTFFLNNQDQFGFSYLEIKDEQNQKIYYYNNQEEFAFNRPDLNLEPVEIQIEGTKTIPNRKKPTMYIGSSDIDLHIPRSNLINEHAIAVVIGNRDYKNPDVPPVDFAIRDAKSIKNYLVHTFGFKEGNIIFVENADQANFYSLFGTKENYKARLYNLVKPGKSDVFVYYSGHGAPDPESREGFFVPSNCDPSLVAFNGYPINTFYSNLSQIPYKSLTVVLDACFSGTSESGMLLKDISPILIQPKIKILSDEKSKIFTSASGDQVSSWYREKGHSLFTYYFLKGIQGEANTDSNRELTMEELRIYLENNVPYMARRINNREQTPEIFGEEGNIVVKY